MLRFRRILDPSQMAGFYAPLLSHLSRLRLFTGRNLMIRALTSTRGLKFTIRLARRGDPSIVKSYTRGSQNKKVIGGGEELEQL